MKVADMGEFRLVDILARMVADSRNDYSACWKQLVLGIGDDCAAWRGDASIQLGHVDSLIENVHFTLDTISWYDLGWKALAATMSDLAAMGGLPRYALVSLTLTGATEVEEVAELYRGMIDLCRRFELAIIGGDTSSAPVVSVTVTVLGGTGKRARKHLMTRSAARPGDKIAITGHAGSAAAGLAMLSGRLKLSAEATAYLKDAFFHPVPRIVEGRLLLEQGVRAAIDTSDGLVSDLTHICKASDVGARIDVEKLPVHPIVRANFAGKAAELALSGGEDYELLFTASDDIIARARETLSCKVTVIGEITRDNAGSIALTRRGKPFILPRPGWEHFKQGQ